jgi:hypothetical protein
MELEDVVEPSSWIRRIFLLRLFGSAARAAT